MELFNTKNEAIQLKVGVQTTDIFVTIFNEDAQVYIEQNNKTCGPYNNISVGIYDFLSKKEAKRRLDKIKKFINHKGEWTE